ncbi:MAG TPA: amino acid ABC transporter permease, partial [Candidatus Competibacteraceae bacterium]|nr:amino acid ABC transporter permease [Candidatus Competibacteraceae bacterium]
MAELHQPRRSLPPPIIEVGPLGWLRHNLFSSPLNTLLTLLALYLLYLIIPPIVGWAFIHADWSGDSREACTSGGACWVFIRARFNQFMYGFYPEAERWRVNASVLLGVIPAIPLFIKIFPYKRWAGLYLLLIYPVLVYF